MRNIEGRLPSIEPLIFLLAFFRNQGDPYLRGVEKNLYIYIYKAFFLLFEYLEQLRNV